MHNLIHNIIHNLIHNLIHNIIHNIIHNLIHNLFQSGVNLKEALICQFPDGTEEIGAAKKGTTLR